MRRCLVLRAKVHDAAFKDRVLDAGGKVGSKKGC